MDRDNNSWWVEEVKETYKLFQITALMILAISLIFFFLSFFQSLSVFGSSENFSILFTLILLLISLLWYIETHFNQASLILSFLLIECFNISFCILSNGALKDHCVILCIISTILTLFFQIGFVQNSKFIFIITLKHIFIWYTFRTLSGDITIHFPVSYTSQIAVVLYIVIGEHIKRQKSIENFGIRKQLEMTQKNLKTILDSFADGLAVLNSDLEILYSNAKISENLQCTQENLISKIKDLNYLENRRSFSHKSHSNLLVDDLILCAKSLTIGQDVSLGLCEKKASIFEWRLKKINWEDSESILLTCTNVTKLIHYEKIYAENCSKSSLIRSFSHELRTPISSILHFIDLSMKSESLAKETKRHLEFASISSKQLFSQINDILDLSNILSNKFKVMKQYFNLRDWVSENIEIFRIIAEEKRIKFDVYVDSLLAQEIYTDPNRLKQVVYSFVSNCFKFTFKGRIQILLMSTADSRLKFEFIDSGIGIPSERKFHLLEFFADTRKSYDSGIGLYTSKMILSFLGNDKICVKSAVGQGSEFSFAVDILPNQRPRIVSDLADPSLEENSDLNSIRLFETKTLYENDCDLLIVDDVELNRLVIISTIKELKIQILEAENGKQAVEIVKKMNEQNRKIRVIIMDCNMPIMDGWEAAKIIKNMEIEGVIKKSPVIIAYTAFSSEEDINLCYQCGMSSYLIKPSSPSTILKTVNYYLRN